MAAVKVTSTPGTSGLGVAVTFEVIGPWSSTVRVIHTWGLVLLTASVPRTHNVCSPPVAGAVKLATTSSVGESKTPSWAFIGVQVPLPNKYSADWILEFPFPLSSTVAVKVILPLGAAGLGTARTLEVTGVKVSRYPDAFLGVSQILHLFSLHDKEELSYGKTVEAISKALLKEKTEIAKVLSMMESFSLLEWKKNEKWGGERTIHLIAGNDFIGKALKIYEILKGYKV